MEQRGMYQMFGLHFFLVIFPTTQLKQKIMYEKLLQMDGLGFYIKQWEPNFDPHKHEMEKIKAWVHNPPSQYRDDEVLIFIGNELDTYIRVDKSLLHGEMKTQVIIYVEINPESTCLDELEIITKEGK